MDTDISFLLFRDAGGQWYAAPPGFQTLLRHPIGRGSTRAEAIDDLVAHPEFIERAKMGEWSPEPRFVDFVEVRAPRWTTWAPFRIDAHAKNPRAGKAPRTSRGNGTTLGHTDAYVR